MSPFAIALMNSRLAHSLPRIRAAECAGVWLKVLHQEWCEHVGDADGGDRICNLRGLVDTASQHRHCEVRNEYLLSGLWIVKGGHEGFGAG